MTFGYKYSFNSSPDISSSELEEIRNRNWRLDCPKITIKNRAKEPIAFYGSGTIQQTVDGRYKFRFYAQRRKGWDSWKNQNSLKSGQVIPDSYFFDLIATDLQGRTWKAEYLLPLVHTVNNKTFVEGDLPEFKCRVQLSSRIKPEGDRLDFWVFENIEIPCNAVTTKTKSIAGERKSSSKIGNAWKFRTLGVAFLFVNEDDKSLAIQASAIKGKFPPHFDDRVLEALQLVIGRPIPWSVARKQTGKSVTTIVSSQRNLSIKARLFPPLPTKPVIEAGKKKVTTTYHRKLFECYLKHTIKSDLKHHLLWGQLNAVYEASTTIFIDSLALTLSVAIESLVQTEFSQLVKLTKAEQEAVQALQGYLEDWEGLISIKNRATGAINRFYETRASDIMRMLQDKGAITQEQMKYWQNLRNPSAHSFQTGNLSSDKLRDLIPKVEVLFYHLVFYAIGYRGLYVDFSELDWPLKTYSPKPLHKAKDRHKDSAPPMK